MEHDIIEIVKEFRIRIDGLDFPIKGRVIKASDGGDGYVYFSEVSHSCKPSELAATNYSPSTVRKDVVQAEIILKDYLKNFTTINVVANKSY